MRKTLVIIIHALAVLCFAAAFSALYTDSTGSAGISWLSAPDYQDSPQFAKAVETDISNIKRMAFLKSAFGEPEELLSGEAEGRVVVEAKYYGEEIFYTIPMLLAQAEKYGDHLDRSTGKYSFSEGNDYTEENYEIQVLFKSYDPDFLQYVTPGPGQGTMQMRALCQELIKYLNEYLTLCERYSSSSLNLHYLVYYPGQEQEYVIVSNTDLPPSSIMNLGRYVQAEGTASGVQTNIEPAPTNATYTPLINRDPDYDEFYELTVGIDTAFPYADSYQEADKAFSGKVNRTYTWIAVGVVSMVFAVITLILILREASIQGENPDGYHRLDRLPFEAFVLILAALSIVFYYCFKATLCKAVETLAPFEQEQYWRDLSKTLIVYGLIILILRSAIRRYRMGILYKNTLFNRMELAIEDYLEHLSLSSLLFIRYLFFAALNVFGTAAAIWLYNTRDMDSRRILMSAGVLAAMLVVDALVYNALFKAARQREIISQALKDISVGETGNKLEEKKFTGHELSVARDINHISEGLSAAVRDQVKSERMKADLITNVSHDIKTPLTSIINYVGLLKREDIRDEKAVEYIDVLERKSERLKKLIEDLVEASKASSGNVKIELAKIDIGELTEQAAAEFEDKFAKRNLEFCFTQPEAPVYVNADGRHLWRIFDNLLNNASKYSLEGTRIYGDVTVTEGDPEGQNPGTCTFTMKNISATRLNISPEELTERFVRGDVSRTTEGSGLGLSIATSLCSLMGGELKIEIDGDLYKANVILPLYVEPEEEKTGEEA